MVETEIVALDVDGIAIIGRLWLPKRDTAQKFPAVCLCHGIPSGAPPDPSDRGYLPLMERLSREGFAVILFNFRGTGESGGNFDIMGWTEDLKAVIDYLCSVPEVDGRHIFLVGFSGGAATAVCVAGEDERVSAVVAGACPADFAFFEAMGPEAVLERLRTAGLIRDKDFPASVAEWFNGFNLLSPLRSVARIAPRPLLLVHSAGDKVVPVEHARRLYYGAGEPKEMLIIEGDEHRLRQSKRAMSFVVRWLKSQAGVI